MNAETSNPAILIETETWSADFGQLPPASVDWIWRGYLARGAVTLLTSQWKSGKTTLLSVLLTRLAQGGELAGLSVSPARVAVVSEERLESWQLRGEKLPFGQNVCFFCRPFRGRPTKESWHALVDRLAHLGDERRVDLVVIDPLAACLPGPVENQSSGLLDVLQPLSRLTAQGQAVLLLHHPRKGSSAAGQLSRGSGALCAFVDILMEMSLVSPGLEEDRRRRIAAWSRFDATPRMFVLELTADGADYRVVDQETLDDPFVRNWPLVERLLAFPPRKLNRQQLLAAWPARMAAPGPAVLWRVLDRAVAEGLLLCEGTGTRSEPFCYWLPTLPADWEPPQDPEDECWSMVQHLLTCPPRKLSRFQLLSLWPTGVAAAPNPVMLWRVLEHAVKEGHLQQEGSGRRGDPFRYYFPNLGAEWQQDVAELLDL